MNEFVRLLALTSVQLLSIGKNVRLLSLSPSLREPRPDGDRDEKTLERVDLIPSLAAGLSRFAEGI